MELYRILRKSYAKNLVASGAANRWNRNNQWVLYAASSRSLATLELLVHQNSIQPHITFAVQVISVPDKSSFIQEIEREALPKNWRSLAAYPTLQQIGGTWYESQKTLLMRVPSAVIPMEFNYVINTQHPAFSQQVKLSFLESYFWDERLL